jgi:hypothetical protein
MRLILSVTTEKELDVALRVARTVFNNPPKETYSGVGTFKNKQGECDYSKPVASTSIRKNDTGYTINTRETRHEDQA